MPAVVYINHVLAGACGQGGRLMEERQWGVKMNGAVADERCGCTVAATDG